MVRSDRLFSAAELRNDIRLIEAAYAEFDLAGTVFGPAAELVRRLSALATDDYWITVAPPMFDHLAVEAGATWQTINAAGQRVQVHNNPPLSGDFQLLTWVRILGTSAVTE